MSWDTVSLVMTAIGILATGAFGIITILLFVISRRDGRRGVERLIGEVRALSRDRGPAFIVGMPRVVWANAFPQEEKPHHPALKEPEKPRPKYPFFQPKRPVDHPGRPEHPYRPSRPDHPGRPGHPFYIGDPPSYQTRPQRGPTHTRPAGPPTHSRPAGPGRMTMR